MNKVFKWLRGYRKYTCTINGYGLSVPYQVVLFAQNKDEAYYRAFHHNTVNYGSDYIISRIDVDKFRKG